jgi:hypothetical protein
LETKRFYSKNKKRKKDGREDRIWTFYEETRETLGKKIYCDIINNVQMQTLFRYVFIRKILGWMFREYMICYCRYAYVKELVWVKT